MGKARNSGPEGAWTASEGARGDALLTAEASENAARSRSDAAAAPALLAPSGARLRSAAPEAPRPSDPKRRSSADPGNRAEASPSDASGPAAAGAPPAPPKLAAAAAGTPARSWAPLPRWSPAAQARGPRRAKASEDWRDKAGAPSAPALPAPGRRRPQPRIGRWRRRHPTRSAVVTEASGTARMDRKPEGAAPGDLGFHGANRPALLASPGRLSGRLASLAETARAYARSAQADNTRRAYAADWKMFASWLPPPGALSETPPDPEAVGLYLLAAQVERGGAELLGRHPRAAAVGHRLALPSDRRAARHPGPAASPPCSPASAAATLALPLQKAVPSSPTSFWPCWRRWTWTSGALRDPGHPGDFLGFARRAAPIRDRWARLRPRTIPTTAPVGSKSSPKAPCSPSAARLAGARSKSSAGARAPTPARSPCSRNLAAARGGSPARPLFRAVARKNGGVFGSERLTDEARRPAW